MATRPFRVPPLVVPPTNRSAPPRYVGPSTRRAFGLAVLELSGARYLDMKAPKTNPHALQFFVVYKWGSPYTWVRVHDYLVGPKKGQRVWTASSEEVLAKHRPAIERAILLLT